MLTEWEDRTMSRDMALIPERSWRNVGDIRDPAVVQRSRARLLIPSNALAENPIPHQALYQSRGSFDASDGAHGTLDSFQVYALTWRGHEYSGDEGRPVSP